MEKGRGSNGAMINLSKKIAKKILNAYLIRICRQEYESQYHARMNERPVEFGFVFRHLSMLYPRKILDVGTGMTSLPHLMQNCGFHVTAIDNVTDYWPAGMINRHFYVLDDDITNTGLNEKYDLITCISVLEHVVKYNDAVRNMIGLLKSGGHLILTCPYTEWKYESNVYLLPGASYGRDLSYICQSFSRKELDRWVKDNNAIIVDQEYWQFWDGLFWTAGKPVTPPRRVGADDKHQLTCVLLKRES